MKKIDNFDMDDLDLDLDMDTSKPEPKEKPFSFNDLDLGLDFDLSFLDDIDESVLDEPVEAPKQPPVKRPAPAASAPKKPASQPTAPKKPAAPAAGAQRPANGQRPANTQRPSNAQKPTNGQRPVNGQRPAGGQPGSQQRPTGAKPPVKQPAAPVEPQSTKKKKSGPRLGGVIFYTLYFLFILIFFLATFLGLNWLHGWLADFEMAQPTVKAEQVFTQLFTDPDWGALYESAGAKDSPYEGKDAYVAYMEDKVGSSKLSYMETSAGLSGNKKYLVRLDGEKVASFTLVDKNKVGTVSLDNLDNLGAIPDWQLGEVEVFFDREGTYYIEKLDGHTAYVNDVALSDDMTIQVATTLAEKYLPTGTTGASMCTQQVTGLMAQPVVTIFDKSGKQMEVTYDETTRTFTERLESNTMSDDERTVALEAAKTFCQWMIKEVTDRGTIAKYYDPTSETYKNIVTTTELWMQSHNGYTFSDENVTDYARYGDDIFSVSVSLNLNVTRTDGSVKTYEYKQSLFFRKNESGKWLCFNATNVDVSQPVGRVRLTFMSGETEVHSQFYGTDSKEIVTPVIPTPEGKVFTGWVTVDKDENGATVYNLQFQPDEEGKVTIPDGTILKPMTLYALFQNPGEATVTEASASATTAADAATEAATEAPAEGA